MGDIFSAEDSAGRCAALRVDPVRLQAAFGGEVAVLDQRWYAGEMEPEALTEACTACEARLVREWGNLPHSTDHESSECVAYWHLRDLRRRGLLVELDRMLCTNAGPGTRDRATEYHRLAVRIRCNAWDCNLPADIAALRCSAFPVLAQLLDMTAHHVAVFRERGSGSWVTPRRGPPPSPLEVSSSSSGGPEGCVVCLERAPSARLPCGHRSTCDACTSLLCHTDPARCPLCRAPFELSAVDWMDSDTVTFLCPRIKNPNPNE